MDVFESDNFYHLGHPGRPAVVGDNEYVNANADSYSNQFRAKFPVSDPNNKSELITAINGLKMELNSATFLINKCPKETWTKAIFTGGLLNLKAKNCKKDAQAKIDGISAALNNYQDMLQALNAAEYQKAQDAKDAAAQAALDKSMASMPSTVNVGGSNGSASAMPWILGGLGILAVGGIMIFAFTKKKPAAAAA